MSFEVPVVKHVYQHHTLDSTRWDKYIPRSDDVIIATPYKSGTTWMQMIVMHLIFQDLQIRPIWEISPWLDNRKKPVQEVIDLLDRQEHRRFIKSHLPLDGLPFHMQAKYIVVGRDGRDVFMSMWNHYSNLAEASYADKERQGFFFPRCPADIRDFWQEWITSGSFAWEHEGYPFWSNLRHVQTWWDFSHLPNILFVHFNDLLSNLEGEIIRIADFLDISVPGELLPDIVEAVSFANVKANADAWLPNVQAWVDGPKTLFHKGTNGRWRDVLTAEDLELYAAAISRELTPECARWLEEGRYGMQAGQALPA